jgi:pilus assembly protein Flp/PilA
MDRFLNRFSHFFKDEEGASAVEYGLIIGLIAVALIVVLGLLGGGLEGLFDAVVDELPAAGGSG